MSFNRSAVSLRAPNPQGKLNACCRRTDGSMGHRHQRRNLPRPTLPLLPDPLQRCHPQIECKERTSELTALVAKEKKAFEESLRRFQEKGAALRAALETAQKAATGNVAALKEKHQVGAVHGCSKTKMY